jgi:hypothetical protein
MPETPEEQLLARLEPLVGNALLHYNAIVREEKMAVKNFIDTGTPELDVIPATFLSRLYPARKHPTLTPAEEMNALERMNHFYGNTLSESQTFLELHKEGIMTAPETLEALAKVAQKYPTQTSSSSLENLQQRVRKATPEEVQGKEDVKEEIEAGLRASIRNFAPLKKALDAITTHVDGPPGAAETPARIR